MSVVFTAGTHNLSPIVLYNGIKQTHLNAFQSQFRRRNRENTRRKWYHQDTVRWTLCPTSSLSRRRYQYIDLSTEGARCRAYCAVGIVGHPLPYLHSHRPSSGRMMYCHPCIRMSRSNMRHLRRVDSGHGATGITVKAAVSGLRWE